MNLFKCAGDAFMIWASKLTTLFSESLVQQQQGEGCARVVIIYSIACTVWSQSRMRCSFLYHSDKPIAIMTATANTSIVFFEAKLLISCTRTMELESPPPSVHSLGVN
jgi:hypothetical protein